jgi:hypothetical protein
MFFNNTNFPLPNEPNRFFTFDETNESKKRKSFSFCAKDDPNKEINLFQNVIGGELNKERAEQDLRSNS